MVGEAQDGASGLAAVAASGPDVVLLDVHLPDGDGFELTGREREVLALMAEGRTNRAISGQLYITERAVERHVTGIFQKLGLTGSEQDHRRVLAVLTYLKA